MKGFAYFRKKPKPGTVIGPLPRPGVGHRLLAFARRRTIITALLVLAIIYAGNIGRYALWPPVAMLGEHNPHMTAFMQYRETQWKRDGRNVTKRQNWRPLNAISPNLRRAVVIAEDSTFWEHNGFDREGLRLALETNWKNLEFSMGGSTITQQLAKNLWFTPEKSITRKLQEAIMAWRLESALSKGRIMELYLNVVEWGDGIYGADAAARHWFGVSAANLTRRQAATLAAMLPGPLNRKPDSRRVQRVAAIILSRMR